MSVARLKREARQLRRLVDNRDDLVTERTRTSVTAFGWQVHELSPGWEIKPTALRRFHVLDEVSAA